MSNLVWLAAVPRGAGLKTIDISGWQHRGHSDFGDPWGVLCHHTAGPKYGAMASLHELIHGRSDLAGPLCNYGLARDGTVYVIAARTAWHAGLGHWPGLITNYANNRLVGIEAENTGYIGGLLADPWPEVQMTAYARLCAAILERIGKPVGHCLGHKEWAPGRKTDPTFDMPTFRERVAIAMSEPALATVS